MTEEKKDYNDNNHYVEYVKDHFQHAVDYGKSLASTTQNAHQELTKKVTDIYAQNMALGKSFLNCKRVDDIVNWGEEFVKANLDSCINGGASIYHKVCTELNEANSEITKKVSKNMEKIRSKIKDLDD